MESSQITVFVKTVSGEKTSIPTTSSTTVLDFKGLVEEHMKIPKTQQRIIFAGHILKDERTLESYGIKDGLSVILVKTTAPATSSSTPTTTTPTPTTPTTSIPTTPVTTTPVTTIPTTTTIPTSTTTPSTQPFPFSLGGGGLNPATMQQQFLQNPNLMREMMNSPIVSQMLQNPEILRSIWTSNPQMRELIERNPEIGHILNDPAILRQTLEAARNPELMRELMRNSDRAVSHLETLPEGFNFLRRMYSDVQEPLMQAATGTGETNPPSTPSTSETTPSTPVNPTPNTAPLPNPWQASAQGTAAPTTGPSLGGFPSMGLGNMDSTQLASMLQNPQMQSAVQSMLSNPALMSTMQQMMERDPNYQQLLQANPHLRSMMTSPEFLQQMTNPNTLQALQQIQSGMSQLQNQGVLPMLMPQLGQMGGGANPAFDMSQLFNSLGGFNSVNTGAAPSIPTTTPTTAPTPSVPQDPETRFRNQLQQLREMGFYDTQRNIQLLLQNNGDVNRTIDQLLNY